MFSLQHIFSSEPVTGARIRVKGRIFDGSYHVYAEQKARDYGLKGWMKVRDGLLPSAFLELEIEGPDEKLKNYINDLRKGNRDSHITMVTVEMMPTGKPQYSGFSRLL